MTALRANLLAFWRRVSRLDLAALLVLLAGFVIALLEVEGGPYSFVKFLAVLSGIYLLFRLIAWGRGWLLWSLRNRLIVASIFMTVVPILLILTLGILASQFLYSQLGAYLLPEDIHRRIETISDISEHIAAARAALPRGVNQEEMERMLASESHTVHDRELLGLTIDFSNDAALLRKVTAPGRNVFSGLLQDQDSLSLVSMREVEMPKGARIVRLSVPVTPEFLATIAPDLGAIQVNLMQLHTGG